MTRYAFDTDTLSLYDRMHPAVVRNVFHHLGDDIRLTTATVEESLGGWLAVVRAAKTPAQTEAAHRRLATAVRMLGTWDVFPMTAAAEVRFRQLLRQRLNVGGGDLRIAAVALEFGATVVTRNVRDFRRIPGLTIEDWSV